MFICVCLCGTEIITNKDCTIASCHVERLHLVKALLSFLSRVLEIVSYTHVLCKPCIAIVVVVIVVFVIHAEKKEREKEREEKKTVHQ